MNKILSIAAVAALLSTGAIADNEITITGEVLPSAVVGFVDVSGQTLTGTDKFIDASIDLGTHEVNTFNADATTASSQSIYVKTNVATGHAVTMKIASENGNNLVDSVSGATIPVVYKIGTTELATDASNSATLATGANAGSTAINDKFTITPTAANDQLAGKYDATLSVTITAS